MNEVHILPTAGDDTGWMIDEDLDVFETQDEAVARARERLDGEGEIVIHGGDGEVRERIQVGAATGA